MIWVESFEKLEFPGRTGRTYDRLDPKKLLLHSTEGSSIAGALHAYSKYPPHVICDFNKRRIVQHVSLDRASYSLRGSDSDDEPCIQVEIVGFSKDAPHWSVEMLDWLCDEVFEPIRRVWPYALEKPPQGFMSAAEARNKGITLASPRSPLRFSKTEFEQFGGICAHQHAPAPDSHWDVPINIDYVLNRMRRRSAKTFITKQDEEMVNEVLANLAGNSHPLAVVDAVYQAVLGRPGDGEGLPYWADIVDKGEYDVFDLIREFSNSVEARS